MAWVVVRMKVEVPSATVVTRMALIWFPRLGTQDETWRAWLEPQPRRADHDFDQNGSIYNIR